MINWDLSMDQSSKVYIKLEDVHDKVAESQENHLSQNNKV